MSVTHSTFTLEREYAVTPARLFAAFSTKEQREKWFGDPSQPPATWDFDFREGGREYTSGEFHGQLSVFDATFHDIVDDERIVFGYNLYVGGAKLSTRLPCAKEAPVACSSSWPRLSKTTPPNRRRNNSSSCRWNKAQ
jgi:uncharacterized protein YndB with AHSA1/START domain